MGISNSKGPDYSWGFCIEITPFGVFSSGELIILN
jgi:hypothetical protein